MKIVWYIYVRYWHVYKYLMVETKTIIWEHVFVKKSRKRSIHEDSWYIYVRFDMYINIWFGSRKMCNNTTHRFNLAPASLSSDSSALSNAARSSCCILSLVLINSWISFNSSFNCGAVAKTSSFWIFQKSRKKCIPWNSEYM